MVKLLVIGGGLAGCTAVVGLRKFNKDAEIVLVEPKDHCEVCWAAFRSPFEEWVAEGSLKSLDAWCETNKVKHIRSTVSKLTESTAHLANGETVDYDVAVIATGAGTKDPFLGRGLRGDEGTKEARLASLKQLGQEILNTKSVLICGGGLIGTELAGDIAGYATKDGKDIKVTLVHSGPHLAHAELPESASGMVLSKLGKLGVKVFLNEKVVESNGKYSLESSGQNVTADKVIFTTGLVAINNFLKDGDFAEALDEKGFIVTDDYFRVRGGKGKVFAVGDCSTFLPNASSQFSDPGNRSKLGKNLHITLDSLSSSNSIPLDADLEKAGKVMQMTLVTVGPKDGVFYTPYFFTQWIFSTLKNRTMFFFRPKYELGLKD